MFVNELFESDTAMNTLVIYPGRFQPWHKGHKAVYDYLVKNFGSDNVFVATTNKVDPPRSPFTFSEKVQFMNLTGISADSIVETRDPYKALEVVQNYDPNTTRLIFAVSEKDMSEDPRFGFKTKKDGSPSYFQPMPKDASDMVPLKQHGYIMTVPTFNFTLLGQPMRSATEVRAQFASADEATQQQIVKDLFGSYDKNVHDIMRLGLGATALNELKFPSNDDGERHEDNYPCYDCGSTILGHHTRLCELAEDWAVRDLPSLPRSQYWTGRIPQGLHPIAGLEDRDPTNEATDPKFVGFMNKSLGDKVDPAKPAPNLPAEYSKFKIASFDNMPGYRPALKFGMSVLQAMDQQTRQHFINSPDDNDPTDAIIVYLIDIAEKKGFMPKYFVEEDIWEVTDWFDEIFADPNLYSWTDLLKSMSGKPGVAEGDVLNFPKTANVGQQRTVNTPKGNITPITIKNPKTTKVPNWNKLPKDVLTLAIDWFWAELENSGSQATTDKTGYGNGTKNRIRYLAAQLQQRGWQIDFDDRFDNILLKNKNNQIIKLSIDDAYDTAGWAKDPLKEFAPGEGGFGPFKVYVSNEFIEEFPTFDQAKEEIEFLRTADPRSANDDWKIIDGTGKTVWQHDPGAAYDEYRMRHKIQFIKPDDKGLVERMLDEFAAGVGVVASKKQKNDPRYKTSLTVDVHPDTPKKNMRALRLI
jgi:hypothetical protein